MRVTAFLGVCAVLAFPRSALAQDEPAVASEIQRLIEETNALETFHVVYELWKSTDGEEERATVELIYSAPDLARLRMSRDDDVVDTWIVDDHFHVYTSQEQRWRRAEIPELGAAGRALEEHFPGEAAPLPPGTVFALALRPPKIEMSIGHIPFDRNVLLQWLRELSSRPDEVVLDDNRLVLEGEGHRSVYSQETGFPELMELWQLENRSRLSLLECRVDAELEPGLTTLPGEARAAGEDEELARGLRRQFGPLLIRSRAYHSALSEVHEGKQPWNDWRGLLEVVHEEALQDVLGAWASTLQRRFDDLCLRIHEHLDDTPDGRGRVEERLADERTRLEASLAEAHDRYVDELPELSPKTETSDLFDIEREVVATLWEERWSARLLAAFDEAVRSGLER